MAATGCDDVEVWRRHRLPPRSGGGGGVGFPPLPPSRQWLRGSRRWRFPAVDPFPPSQIWPEEGGATVAARPDVGRPGGGGWGGIFFIRQKYFHSGGYDACKDGGATYEEIFAGKLLSRLRKSTIFVGLYVQVGLPPT